MFVIGPTEMVYMYGNILTPSTPRISAPWVGGSWMFCQTKPWLLNWQPRLDLTEDSRTTDFCLGLIILILIRMASSRQLWTDWLTWPENLPLECRGLKPPPPPSNGVFWYHFRSYGWYKRYTKFVNRRTSRRITFCSCCRYFSCYSCETF